jgi:pimeloyl-ACP methyl ester carboxylesterase
MDYRRIDYSSADGLSLQARDYGPDSGGLTPVVCLPGLTRNAKDFEIIAPRLATVRRVICPDFRGRGRSQYAADPMTYRPDIEQADTLVLLDRLGMGRVAVIGTSRGGIVAMFMAAKAKQRLAGVALNDIGPRVGQAGLLRIRSYLGNDPEYDSWAEAADALKATNPGFDSLDADEWLAFARRVFRAENGRPRADYDANLTAAFPSIEDIGAGKAPELWDLFDHLIPLPSLVLRGANSDLLSAATVAEMMQHHPALAAVTVAGRGHVPFLDEPESIAAIDHWLAAVDAQESGRS